MNRIILLGLALLLAACGRAPLADDAIPMGGFVEAADDLLDGTTGQPILAATSRGLTYKNGNSCRESVRLSINGKLSDKAFLGPPKPCNQDYKSAACTVGINQERLRHPGVTLNAKNTQCYFVR